MEFARGALKEKVVLAKPPSNEQAEEVCLGIDVFDRIITVAVDDGEQPPGIFCEVAYQIGRLREVVAALQADGGSLHAVYAIESASFALRRWLGAFGVRSTVVTRPELQARGLPSQAEREQSAYDLAIGLRRGDLKPLELSVPALVADAMTSADQAGFLLSCIPEFGRVLHALAKLKAGGRFAEVGTGCGVGTAWMATAVAGTETTILTAELDPTWGRVAREALKEWSNVTIHIGDWRDVFSSGELFDLIFADGAYSKGPGTCLVDMVRRGGVIVMDDVVPRSHADEWAGSDVIRDFWFEEQANDFAVVEIMTATDAAAIFAVRH